MSCWTAGPALAKAWTREASAPASWTPQAPPPMAWPLQPRWLVLEQGGFLEFEDCAPLALEEAP